MKADSEKKKAFLKFIIRITIECLFVFALFRTVFMLCVIPSESMVHTLEVGDILIGTRYDARKVKRYDIMVFVPPDHPDTYYIKRVIGLPGETVKVKDGNVYANGKELDSSFVNGSQNNDGDGIYKIPKGHYFMMGDNRNNSEDSRFWTHKYVPRENLICHARIRIYPFNRMRIFAHS